MQSVDKLSGESLEHFVDAADAQSFMSDVGDVMARSKAKHVADSSRSKRH